MKQKFHKGFTLIELLVVISIIALLSSIVLGSLDAARNKAKIAAGEQFDASTNHALGDLLLAEWNFDDCSTSGVTNDSSGNNRNLTIVSATLSSSNTYTGKGCSLVLNGSGYGSYANFPNLSGLDKTVSAWINVNSNGGTYYGIVDDDDGNNGWGLWINQRNGFPASLDWWLQSGKDLISSSTIPQGIWTQIAVSWTASTKTANFYVNGAEISSLTNTSITENPTTYPVSVGSFRNGSNKFSGSIDNVRVYNSSLSSIAIRNEYLAEAPKYASVADAAQ